MWKQDQQGRLSKGWTQVFVPRQLISETMLLTSLLDKEKEV